MFPRYIPFIISIMGMNSSSHTFFKREFQNHVFVNLLIGTRYSPL